MTPEIVATARRALAEVQDARQAATNKTAVIRARLSDAHARQAEITGLRMAGTVSPGDTAEYAVLGGDIGALTQMLADSLASIEAADPHQAQEHLRTVEKAYARELATEEFTALEVRATALDTALCAVVSDLHQAGLRSGRQPSLCMSWRPSKALADAVHLGRTP